MKNFGHIITAMVTPFDELGKVDEKKAKALVKHLLSSGTESIVVAGTTGEGPTLSKKEKIDLFRLVKLELAGKHPMIANVGSNNTQETIDFIRVVEEQGVADALLLANPYYNKPSQEGLYQHFKAIAESTKLPIMLYNIPGRTSVNLEAETTIRLSLIPNIVSIKEASGNLSQIAKVIEGTSADFTVYSGDDNLTLPILALGGDGVVSVASHIVGKQMQDMITLFYEGYTEDAAQLHRKLLPIFEGIFIATNPTPIKEILNMSGIEVGGVRLPLVHVTDTEYSFLKELTKSLDI